MLSLTLVLSILTCLLITDGVTKAVQSNTDMDTMEEVHEDVWSDYHILKTDDPEDSDQHFNLEENPLTQDTEVMDYEIIEEIKQLLEHEMIDQLNSNLIIQDSMDNEVNKIESDEGFDYQLLESDEGDDIYERFSSFENGASNQDFKEDDINNSDVGEGYDYQLLNSDEMEDSDGNLNSEVNDENNQDMDVIDYEVVEEIKELLEHEVVDGIESNLIMKEFSTTDNTEDIIDKSDPGEGSISQSDVFQDANIVAILGGEMEMYKEIKLKTIFLENQMEAYQGVSSLSNEVAFLQTALKTLDRDSLIQFAETLHSVEELIVKVGGKIDPSAIGDIKDVLMKAERFLKDAMLKLDVLERANVELRKRKKDDDNGVENADEIIEELEEAIVASSSSIDIVEELEKAIVVSSPTKDSQLNGGEYGTMSTPEEVIMNELGSNKISGINSNKSNMDKVAEELMDVLEEVVIRENGGEKSEELEEAIVQTSYSKDDQVDEGKNGGKRTHEGLEMGELVSNEIDGDNSKKDNVAQDNVSKELMNARQQVISDFSSHDTKNDDQQSFDTEVTPKNQNENAMNGDKKADGQHDNSELNLGKLDRRISPKFKHLFAKSKEESKSLLSDILTTHHHEFESVSSARMSSWSVVWLPTLAGLTVLLALVGFLGFKLYEKRRAIAAYTWDGNFHSELINENYEGGCCSNKLK